MNASGACVGIGQIAKCAVGGAQCDSEVGAVYVSDCEIGQGRGDTNTHRLDTCGDSQQCRRFVDFVQDDLAGGHHVGELRIAHDVASAC